MLHMVVRLLMNTCGSRSHCSKPPKEERELKSHGTTRCRPWHQGSSDSRSCAYSSSRRAQTVLFGCSRRPGATAFRLVDGSAAGCAQQACGLELLDARRVRLRPGALRLARREVERGALGVDRARLAVDPAEAEGLFDGRVVVDPRLAGRLLPRHEPHTDCGLVVALEPVTPVGAALELHDLGCVAHAGCFASPTAIPAGSSPLSGRAELRSGTSRSSHVKRKEKPAIADAVTKTGWSAAATACTYASWAAGGSAL